MKRILGMITVFVLLNIPFTAANASINCQKLAKEMNFHAYQLAVANCGVSSAPLAAPSSSTVLGGTDQNIITGGEGTYPHVTQSETQTWANGSTIVTAYNDSRTASSCYAGGSYSLDGGATWSNLNTRPFCSGHGTNYGDPVVFYDALHTHWNVITLATGCGGQGMGVWSSNDGVTWATGSCAHNGSNDDRESGWVDNSPTSPHYGREYLTWNDFNFANANIFSTFSDDGGVTWSSPQIVESNAAFIRNVQVTTGPDGTVFIAGMDEGGGGLANRTNYVFRSTDGGASWASIQGASFTAPGSSTCGYFAAMFPSYWRHMGWGDIGVGPSGVVHYAFAEGGIGDSGNIFYTRSTDNGSTWSVPIKLNTDTTTRAQWQPSLSVSSSGNVFVSWYDQRNTTGTSYERFGIVSNDNGATWGTDDDLSDVVSPLPAQPDPAVQPCYAGDYDRSFTTNTAGYTAWVDGRVAVSGVSQQDVFFDTVGVTAPPITLTATGFKTKGLQRATLTWSPTVTGDTIQVFRNSVVTTTVADTGTYTDNTGKKGPNGTWVYRVCRVETSECSNLATVKFGKG